MGTSGVIGSIQNGDISNAVGNGISTIGLAAGGQPGQTLQSLGLTATNLGNEIVAGDASGAILAGTQGLANTLGTQNQGGQIV